MPISIFPLRFTTASICGCSAISQQISVKSQWNTTFEKIACSYCVPNADFYVLLAFHYRSLLSCTAIVATLCSRILTEQTIGEVCPEYNPIRFPLGAASVILILMHSVNCLPLLLVLLLPLFLRCCCRQQCLLAAACCSMCVFAACCLLHNACCVLHAACCLLHAACCMLRFSCLLLAACYLLLAACCVLRAACCLMCAFAACCLLLNVCVCCVLLAA